MKNFLNQKKGQPTIDTVEAVLPPSFARPEIGAIQQVITARTRLFVVASDGISEMTLRDIANAFRGGMNADEIAICSTQGAARAVLEERRQETTP